MNIDLFINYLTKTRQNLIKVVEPLDLDQLNLIPTGFNNNLFWNLAHCAVTQQLLCYGLSGNALSFDNDIITAYRKGSKPNGSVEQAFVDQIIEALKSSPDQMLNDYKKGLFKDYKSYATSYGVTLNSIEEAINFNNIHEAMHLGTMMAMSKFV